MRSKFIEVVSEDALSFRISFEARTRNTFGVNVVDALVSTWHHLLAEPRRRPRSGISTCRVAAKIGHTHIQSGREILRVLSL